MHRRTASQLAWIFCFHVIHKEAIKCNQVCECIVTRTHRNFLRNLRAEIGDGSHNFLSVEDCVTTHEGSILCLCVPRTRQESLTSSTSFPAAPLPPARPLSRSGRRGVCLDSCVGRSICQYSTKPSAAHGWGQAWGRELGVMTRLGLMDGKERQPPYYFVLCREFCPAFLHAIQLKWFPPGIVLLTLF